jgi:gluconate 2-dehydrogenase gamma chain
VGDDNAELGEVYLFLTEPEVRFLNATAARLIPADELGPGAKEAGVTSFIDRQLGGIWGVHGRNYHMGPWRKGTPQQGFQSPLTPQEIYRAAIRETNIWCNRKYGSVFDQLAPDQQDEVLSALEQDKVELESVSSRLFFDLLLRNTEEGFFSDPMYGGNSGKIGWRLIGFPGIASADYGEKLADYDVAYDVEPVSILDIQQKRAKVDAQGYPRHRRLNDPSPTGGDSGH